MQINYLSPVRIMLAALPTLLPPDVIKASRRTS